MWNYVICVIWTLLESKLSDLKSHDQNILDRGDRGVDGCSGGGLVAVV